MYTGKVVKGRASVLVLTLLLAACAAGGPLVTPGPQRVGSQLTIDAGMEWTRLPRV